MEDIKISPTAQYIIDAVRRLRLEAGITQRELSNIISPSSDLSIVSNIESVKRSNKYTDHQLNLIANYFGCTVYDFYPANILDDTPQVKTRVTIPKGLGPTGIINALLEEGKFFSVPQTIRETTDYCNEYYKESRPVTDYTAILERAVEKGGLKKVELDSGNVQYQQV
ncbi:helix-turn-helix domain-containing protein [Pontibacter virosus]|uniref:HTH cro/C1-type domain-containing protein n=1 Tax=Pontibacter virosus TaxID=1765052 RepID=A0A2U1B4M9_9BACT|nr:helix-turn-helix transcriptional regulator [Pontibacter virosus]PVY43646.1 hypothetical protein C8E01_1012 [Pontibacter virosus]